MKKYKCVGYVDEFFTIGEIYEIDDHGLLIDDEGEARRYVLPYGEFEPVESAANEPPMSMQVFRTMLDEYTDNKLTYHQPNPCGYEKEIYCSKAYFARQELEEAYEKLLRHYEANT